jgi:hypothetical protein
MLGALPGLAPPPSPAAEPESAPAPASPTLDVAVPEAPEPAPLELCATVTARIHVSPARVDEELSAAKLEEEHFANSCEHWESVVEEQLRRGDKTTLTAFDEAYVAAVEELCGPIEPEHHARIELASERGAVEDTLADLGLPAPGLMRIRRICTQRLCAQSAHRERYFATLDRQ